MTIDFMAPILAAERLSVDTLIMLGVAGTLIVTMFTFANWRFGVKAAFIIVLLEGAIRKWVFPQGQELVYFLKDIFLIGAYLKFYFSPDSDIRAWRIRAPVGLVLLMCCLISFSAMNPNIGSVVLALYGLKIYLFYIPLAFMIPYLFRSKEEMTESFFWYAMMATPICLLGVAQFAAPGYSFLNVYAQTGMGFDATGFGFGEKVRITGTFSYITGHTTFVVIFTTLHLALLMNKMPKWKMIALACNLPLLAANSFMGGSRGSMIAIGFITAAFLIFSIFTKVGTGSNAILVIGGGAAVVALVIGSFFSEAKEQWMTRLRLSDDTVYERVIGMQSNSMQQAINETGLFGYGIGMTHPALERLRNALKIRRPEHIPPVFDSEAGQIWAELGLLGWVAWYALRAAMMVGAYVSFTRCPEGPLKSVILGTLLINVPYLVMSVMLNHTANFLIFALYGVTLIPTLHPAVTRTSRPASAPLLGPEPARQTGPNWRA